MSDWRTPIDLVSGDDMRAAVLAADLTGQPARCGDVTVTPHDDGTVSVRVDMAVTLPAHVDTIAVSFKP